MEGMGRLSGESSSINRELITVVRVVAKGGEVLDQESGQEGRKRVCWRRACVSEKGKKEFKMWLRLQAARKPDQAIKKIRQVP